MSGLVQMTALPLLIVFALVAACCGQQAATPAATSAAAAGEREDQQTNAALAEPSCKNEHGKNVDFAYAFKYPTGFDYAYMDADTELAKSVHQLDIASSSVSTTLAQMLKPGVSYTVWNDQPPPHGSVGPPAAHAKGVLAFTKRGGFWLTHSLPNFPSQDAQSAADLWRDASKDFGQSFLCITLTADEINKISPAMKIDRPKVYQYNFAAKEDEETFADIKAWAVDKQYDTVNMTTHLSVTSKGGQKFTVFGKSAHWGAGKDLYRDLVAPALGGLDVEAWRRGANPWGPACEGRHEVLDVMRVAFPGRDWPVTDDHSKWAVTRAGSALCVGDMNRMEGQDKRGGGTVCIESASLTRQMKRVIGDTDKCQEGFVVYT